jgi:hypothetical protein
MTMTQSNPDFEAPVMPLPPQPPVEWDEPVAKVSVFDYPALQQGFASQVEAINWVYSLGDGCPRYKVQRCNQDEWEALQTWLAVY